MRTRIFLASLLFAASPAFALETKPVEASPALTEAPTAALSPAPAPVSLTLEEEDGATITVRLPSGKEQREENLGQEFAPFSLGGRPVAQAEAHDIDGDGVAEVVARTVVPGGDGALYVFRLDAEKARFRAITAADGDEFLYVDPKSAVNVEGGVITVKDGKASAAYEIKDGRFVARVRKPASKEM